MMNRFGVEEKKYLGCWDTSHQRIRKERNVVAPVAYGMLRRLECLDVGTPETERRFWSGALFNSGEGVAEHPDGRYKFVYDAFSGDFQRWGKMEGGEFVLGDGVYESLPGIEFVRDKDRLNRDFTLYEALSLREWNVLTRHSDIVSSEKAFDKRLLEQYARRCVFPRFETGMGIYLFEVPQKQRLREFYVGRLDGYWGSRVNSADPVNDYGCLVGVAPEALEAARLRSFEVCERLSQMEYPVLYGEENLKSVGGQSVSQREPRVESRYDIALERDGASIPTDSVKQALAKLRDGAKYTPEVIDDFERTLYLNIDQKEEGK